jgi:hypothetical protein
MSNIFQEYERAVIFRLGRLLKGLKSVFTFKPSLAQQIEIFHDFCLHLFTFPPPVGKYLPLLSSP